MTNILICGASSGIGYEVARNAGKDLRLWSAGRRRPAIDRIEHLTWNALEDPFPKEQLPEQLDGLVYTPGSIHLAPFNRLSESQFMEDLNINLMGAVKSVQACLPALKKSMSGSIVLISTVAVTTGMPMHASIAAAKGAVEGLTRSLAAELAPTIRVNAVAPSLTNTPLAAKLLKTERQQTGAAARHPLNRTGNPQDIACAIRYLLSKESSWVTGQILNVDGGMSSIRRFS